MSKKKLSKIETAKIDVAEGVLFSLIRDIGPSGFATALNNACCHGDVFCVDGTALDDNDVLLGEWYEGIEKLLETAKRIEKFNNGELDIQGGQSDDF